MAPTLVENNSMFPLGPTWLLKALLFLESPTKFPDGPFLWGNQSLAHEKTPANITFTGVPQSDADGTRTRNHRIDRKVNDPTLTREKPTQNSPADSWATTGATRKFSLELQKWIQSCPVQLEDWQIKTLLSILDQSRQAVLIASSRKREQRIILLDE